MLIGEEDMGENEVDSENKILEEFELGNELSALVEKKIIPQRIAEKLEQKLKKNKIKISKKQLYLLADKIKNAMRTYSKFDKPEKDEMPKLETLEKRPEMDMKRLVETVEKLREKLNNIESGTANKNDKTSSPKIVTTDDIQVPEKISVSVQEWKLDPLAKIPSDPESIIVLMKWLQFLIDKCGRSNLPDILDYYVDIEWISEDTKINLIDYSNGITEENIKGETVRRKATDLPARDHIQSLLFIQKLKGRQFDKHFLERIDGEISRLNKKLDNYQLK